VPSVDFEGRATAYLYDNTIRISRTAGGAKTIYVVDLQIPSGYSQVLE
jgi:hypothetical protein